MVHIHTDAGNHDFTASAMIVRKVKGQQKVLLVNHKKYHKYIQPGGHVELHENPWQAVMHEILEETGYEANQLRIMQPNDTMTTITGGTILHPHAMFTNTHVATSGHFHVDTLYLFETDELPRQKPGEDESHDLIWVSQGELSQIPDEQVFADTKDMMNHAFTHYIPVWHALSLDTFSVDNPTEG
jgi:8-oxo-dGTP diphosphatase